MADFADDFDEAPEEDIPGPILPRDDRLWRHPSELHKERASQLDPIAVRRKWLQTQPTRASAWTAGLVGALLATGLVVLGTHLAGALTGDSSPASSPSSLTVSSVAANPSLPTSFTALGSTVALAVSRASHAMAKVSVTVDGLNSEMYGLVVNSAGFLVIPYTAGSDITSILVSSNSGVQYVGRVVGVDAKLGFDLIHINGAKDLPTARFASGSPIASGSLVVAVTAISGSSAIGSLHSLKDPPKLGPAAITGAMSADLGASVAPPGAVMINGIGRISGFVAEEISGHPIVVPGSLLGSAIDFLMTSQVLSTRVLGISCETAALDASRPGGARISSVSQGSIGSEAGLAVGEIIVSVNGMTVTSTATLESTLQQASPRAPLLLTVISGSSSRTVVIPASIASAP